MVGFGGTPTADSSIAIPCPSDKNAIRNPPRQNVSTVSEIFIKDLTDLINQIYTILSLAAFSTASALICANRSASSGTCLFTTGLNHSTGCRGFPEGCLTETVPSAL